MSGAVFDHYKDDCQPKPVAPPVTGTFVVCPAVWPQVWTVDGQTYTSVVAFKAALDALLGQTTTFTAPCTFTATAGTVFPPLTFTAVAPPIPAPTGSCGVTNASGQLTITVPVGYVAQVTAAMPPDTAITAGVTVGSVTADYTVGCACWSLSNVDTAPLGAASGTLWAAKTYTLKTFPVRAGVNICYDLVAMTPSQILLATTSATC